MKCFEKLVGNHIMSFLSPTFDQHQFAFRANRSTEDTIAIVSHTALSHLEQQGSYVQMFFIDSSSAFNTTLPDRLVCKLVDLGQSHSTSRCVLNFLRDHKGLEWTPTPPCPSASALAYHRVVGWAPSLHPLQLMTDPHLLQEYRQICRWHHNSGANRLRNNSAYGWRWAAHDVVQKKQLAPLSNPCPPMGSSDFWKSTLR